MLSSLPPYISYLLAIIVSATVSFYAVKKLIFITRQRKIYDIPDNIRKIHGAEIPSLGGIGIFIGYIATIPFFMGNAGNGFYAFITSAVILFFTGIYDDLMNMRPIKKLLAQFIAVTITAVLADMRILSLHGFLGMQELPYAASVALTVFLGTFFVNVFNFIDGIDGLACMLGILDCAVLGIFFVIEDNVTGASICFCLLGAIVGLLYYNYAPAKIYMGDTGSMLIGFSIFIFALQLLRFPMLAYSGHHEHHNSPEVIYVIAILFYPMFDAIRVFILRARKGISPLSADRRHLHYYLLDSGMSHIETAWLLTAVNATTIVFAVVMLAAPFIVQLATVAIPSVAVALFARSRQKK